MRLLIIIGLQLRCNDFICFYSVLAEKQGKVIMGKIEDIDKNFRIEKVGERELIFIDVTEEPFVLTGFYWFAEDGKFLRLPEKALSSMSEGVAFLAWHTSGGMLRFKTDSKSLALRAKLSEIPMMMHMPASGNSGFDLYEGSGINKTFLRNVMPAYNSDEIDVMLFENYDEKMREFTLYFPLYNGVKEIFLGFEQGSSIEAPSEFTISKPIVFYGSSITQGGCASRPGTAYTHFLTRWVDANMINLGFSGNARGELELAELISSIDMSVFVYDYDHNAPDVEHLSKTHQPFFDVIRKARPELAIIIVGRPDYDKNMRDSDLRRDVLYKTYSQALKSGDDKVFWVDGERLFGSDNRDSCTVDGCHPNDLGFYRMAEDILPILKRALSIKL